MSEAAEIHTSESRPPLSHEISPFFNFKIGALDCVALSDGYVQAPLRGLAPEIPEDELRRFLTSHGDETDGRRTLISCLFVRSREGGGMLVDAGIGCLPGPAGLPIPTAGQLPRALAAAGVDGGTIETVLVSHIHPDHIGGLFDEADQPAFPNARYYVSNEEIAFWSQPSPDLDGTLMPPPMRVDAIRDAKRFLALAGKRLVPFDAGGDVMEGVTSVLLDGHTPGQVGFLFQGGEESLFYTADAAPHRSISFKKPEWRFSFDADAKAATSTRKRLMELLLEKNWVIFTPHFPWPPIGRLARQHGETHWIQAV